jgi:MFS transporter, SP family, xylose:H+ symportor
VHIAIDSTSDNGVSEVRTAYVWMIASAAALGGLLFGYDWVVIGGARPFYERYFHLDSEALIGWANSCALLGCLVGAMFSGALSDRFGRKAMLILAAAIFVVTSLYTGWAEDFSSFVLWRILGGVAIGLSSTISPTYIAEISPASMRGRLTTLNQLAIVIGIVAAQLTNWLIAQPVPADATDAMILSSWNGQSGWRWMFIAVAAPSALFFVCSLFIPESPRWLEMKGRHDAARKVLRRISGESAAQHQIEEIHAAVEAEPAGLPHWRTLLSPALRPILMVAIALTVLQQWSGINIIFNYAEEIYRGAGYGLDGVMFNIIINGAINLVFTVIALLTVDRFGRRILMLIGCAGLAISHLLLGLAYAAGLTGWPILFVTLCSIGIYGLSLAPVTWVLVVEVFPTPVRSIGVSIAVSALWIASFLLTFTFPLLQAAAGAAGTFWIYAAVCFTGFLFVWKAIPETKGQELEEVGAAFAWGDAEIPGVPTAARNVGSN